MLTVNSKRNVSLLLAICMIAALFFAAPSASAATASGTTGDCTWTLDGTHLTISGNGYMENYWGNGSRPWGKAVTSVTVEQGVTSIGSYAFEGCKRLTSVTIPDSVTSVGDWAFDGCTGLTSITVPDSVTSIGVATFFGCENLKDVYYTGDLSDWCKIKFKVDTSNPMSYATNLYINGKLLKGEITIPDDVTSIGIWAFLGCTGLTGITIPDSVISIGGGVFCGCTSLTSITIPDSVTNIDGDAFRGCTSLTSVIIPDSVIEIGGSAFSYCTSLTSITIPNSVTSIGGGAFYWCTSLASITIPDSVISIGGYGSGVLRGTFEGCTNLKDVYYTGDLGDWCKINFYGYYSNPMSYATNLYINGKLLKGEITIPDDVASIGDYIFQGCTGLTSITIPDSVTSIGGWAFSDCNNLVIKTTENSTAHKYAAEHNIKYELIEPVTVEGDDKNITISTDSSVIPSEGVSLSTEKVENIGEKYEAQLKNLGTEKFTAYNIDLMKGEEKVQPNGKVTVSIAVPDGMDGAKCKVYRAESDGTLTDMKASLNDGKLTFTTDHFSLYIITQSAVKLGDVNGDGGVTIKDAIAILRHNAEVELLTGSQTIAGDLNGDGTVNTKDAILLLQYNAQIIDKFPIE